MLPNKSFTQIPTFYFPIPFGTVTPETQPLLEYQRSTLRTHSYIHPSRNSYILNRDLRKNRQKTVCSLIIQIQASFAVLLFIFVVYVAVFDHMGWNGVREKDGERKSHFELGHYGADVLAYHRNDTGVFDVAVEQATPLGMTQLKGVEFAIVYFMAFLAALVARSPGYLMSKWGACVGCDEFSDEELEERCEQQALIAGE
ncbi:hypothetical protein SBOR_3499 [Sclerotinia borealis F-4128]|uniref:Uncharacterized protein n=1 Tax=Sclerotinia borealis (strain F-4128) TaxID=1432307 RepID=W9CNM7_SCLBF|nr:hypothetical protein SBOR_3499 [Sclerotinia borealis F-4128]